MKLGNGQQAITDTAYGVSKWDGEKGEQTIIDIQYYPAECVNPPAGAKSVDWIKGGRKGAKC
jgi:branched-chain amino acid transport system substrate-binding protein